MHLGTDGYVPDDAARSNNMMQTAKHGRSDAAASGWTGRERAGCRRGCREEEVEIAGASFQVAALYAGCELNDDFVSPSLATGNLEEIFHIAAELGVGTVIHPFTPADLWRTPSDVQYVADILSQAADVAMRHGLRVADHNHAGSCPPRSLGARSWKCSPTSPTGRAPPVKTFQHC